MRRTRAAGTVGRASPFGIVTPRRAFHSSTRSHNRATRKEEDDDNDDSPWGDLDKAFENLQDKSLYQQVYRKHDGESAAAAARSAHADAQSHSPAKDPIAEMEEAIFARAGAAAVAAPTRSRAVSTTPLSGVRFSDAPPSAPTVLGGGGSLAQSGRWSEYMQDGSAADDSPWSSLDAFVDNPDASAEFAVPVDLAAQHRLMQRSAQLERDPASQRGTSRPPASAAAAALEANDELLRQQAQLLTREEEAFAQAGAAAVSAHDSSLAVASDEVEAGRLSHIDEQTGTASMVDVSAKPTTARSATAVGRVYLPYEAAQLVRAAEARGGVSGKGPVLHTAQLAGIMAAKRTADLIPLCHPLALTHVDVRLALIDTQPHTESYVDVECTAKTAAPTGVEMEALTACTAACLTVWDMVKAVAGKTMRIADIRVVRKTGGKSGDWIRTH